MAAIPTLRSDIEYSVEKAVEKIFLAYQEKYKIETGDCDPLVAHALAESEKTLSKQIESILVSQMPAPTLCGFVWEHGDKDITAWEVTLSEEDRDAIEKILMKYDGQGYSVRNVYDYPFSEVF